jgi:spermidine/putrescine transport system ATP-binding protein
MDDKKVIVKLEDFGKSYGNKEVIKNVNLEVYEGEFITLLGSSGCGKTTILRSISGLDEPTKGKVYIDGEDVTHVEARKRQVNTIFQNYALFPLMTVYDNVAFGLRMKKVPEDEIKKRVNKMIKLVHLEGYEERLPKELSGGEQQRVSIIRGLINNPKVLLLDEPLSALDLKLRKKMQIELKLLQRKLGITFIYVTHDQDEALSMSDRIVVIRNGNIEQIGTPVDVYEKPNSLYVADFLGEANVFKGYISKIDKDKAIIKTDIEDLVINNNNYTLNDKISIVIRPENIKLTKVKRKNNCLQGIITNMVYDGYITKVFVEVNGKSYELIIKGNDNEYKENEEVFIYWTLEDAIIIGANNEKKK